MIRMVRLYALFSSFVTSFVLFFISAFFILFSFSPSTISQFLLSLTGEAAFLSLTLGILLALFSSYLFIQGIKNFFQKKVLVIHGSFPVFVRKKLIEEASKRIWEDFFHEKKPPIQVALFGKKLIIEGKTPEGFNNKEALSKYFSTNIYHMTGFHDEIEIRLVSSKTESL
jgi:hypothetical protein